MKRFCLYLLMHLLGFMSFAQKKEFDSYDLTSAVKMLNEVYHNGKDKSKLRDLSSEFMFSKNENINMLGYSAMSLVEDNEGKDSLKRLIINKFPNGYLVRQLEFDKLIQDSIITVDQYELCINDFYRRFPKSYFQSLKSAEKFGFNPLSFYDWSYLEISKKFINSKNYELALHYVLLTDSLTKKLESYSIVGQQLLDLRENSKALMLSDKAYYILNKHDKPVIDEATVTQVNHIYLKSLIATDSTNQAISLANKLYNEGDRTLFIIKYLIQRYRDKLSYKEALHIIEDNIVQNHYSIVEIISDNELQQLYTKVGDSRSYDSYLSDLRNKAKDNRIANLKSQLIKRSAQDFSLYNLENKMVNLSDFRGKVVILDFWATWCGPCIRSFPGMQSLVNKYKNDEDVQFLFINTSQKEPDFKSIVSEFIKNNNYSFNVLFDEMTDWNKRIATLYEVKALPTKIIIDKYGDIRFHSSGSSSSIDEIMNDLITRIEIVKNL
ncbi:TlpA family protein disulfide reductase [Sphingobacterium bovistauri]|uniref:TlpA family protein disulfide reductase n=1 Tax=Sphingobacterium bovistauri TaxID=2781959 RepID=A0ABS7Z244_9SPHI|nr:TlpA disulfide reductase family protein [Sphingobacterium bovistauri]MCA5004201.1 TlpA family protein disulfide reductase [Sphingobacterium bovistauri]